jgi:hypothetical protein
VRDPGYLAIYKEFDPPYVTFTNAMLGAAFPQELALVSRLWFACGYRPGIASYLNFFLLRDFIETHDTAFPPRFAAFGPMGKSFYQTDLFVRDVTDSGKQPTGGISSLKMRALLHGIMARHQRVRIPSWMMTYFGFSLTEMVEKHCAPLTEAERQLHLAYMAKAYRIMGLAFSDQRGPMMAFARSVEAAHAGLAPQAEQHARNILVLGEMVGVSSSFEAIGAMLPPATRAVFEPIYPRVRPNPLRRLFARVVGRFAVPQAIGAPRPAVPVSDGT